MGTRATERTIAVVDGNSLLHRAFHALPPTMTAPDGRPTNATFGFVSMLVKLVTDLRPDGVIVAFDRGKPAFRTEALEQYKVHRPPTAEELRAQFPMVKEILGALAVPVVEIEGWEGDDVLGAIARRAADEGIRVLLVTGDRDALQLVRDGVSVVTTKKGITDIVVYDPDAVRERYGVTPEQIPDYLGLKGDTSDNIPGVPGVGEKTAAKLIAEYGSLDAVLEHATEIPGKLGENLREHADAARASRVVATIRSDVPFELDLQEVSWGSWRPDEVALAFGELRFTSLLDRVLASATSRATGIGTDDRGPDVQGGVTGEVAVPVGRGNEPWPILAGVEAREWLDREIEDSGSPFGVALDDGGAESLFADRRDLAIARTGRVGVFTGEDAREAFGELTRLGVMAAGDVKGLLHAFCWENGRRSASALEEVGVARLFDCGVAAYLLESTRSSYDLRGLYADYEGSAPPEPSDGIGAAAVEAQAAVLLAPVLERALSDDGSAECFARIEMPLLPVLARMERVGVGIDAAVLAELAGETAAGIEGLRSRIFELAGTEFTIDSPKQLGEVLFDKLGLPKGKRTKTGWSTDASVLTMLAGAGYAIAERIIEYRELTKLRSTYIEALPRLLAEDGRLHTTFNQTVAATGRLSSSSPNLQNIPVRTELGRRIRAAFVPAEPGDLIVSADYSQIELRILAHLSGDVGLLDAFTSGTDFHAATASRVFGLPITELTSEHRRRAKAVNFGIVYGISAHGLAESLKIERAEAQAMIDRYFAAYPDVRRFLDETVASAHRDGWIATMFGRKRRIPELGSSNRNLRSFGERTAMNHPMQGTAADVMKLAMIEVDRRLRAESFRARMVLQVHDELVFESPPNEVERLADMAREAMQKVAALAVPLAVDVHWGADWAAAK